MSQDDVAAVPAPSSRVKEQALSYWVLAFGLGITALISTTFIRAVKEKENLRLQTQASEIESRVRSRFSRHVASLLGGAALFAVDSRVTMSEFRNFTERLMRFGGLSGMQGLGFARRVEPSELRAYEYSVRRDIPGFRVWPEGGRAEYYAVEFVEPQDWRNASAIGYDMFTDAVRREAMERARDTGEPAASGRLTVVQDTPPERSNGFVIYVPAYRRGPLPTNEEERRRNLIGFVYSPYRGKDFLDLALTPTERERFEVSIYDGETNDPKRAIYEAPRDPEAQFIAKKTFALAGRTFTLHLNARPAAPGASRWGGVVIGTALGLLVTVLLFAMTRFQVTARMEAERHAERLRQARAEAIRNLRTRDAFLSIASHELKTPLTALQLQVDGLHRAFASNRPMDIERVQRRLESVRRQARRLTTLVDDLLDVSRLSSGQLSLVLEPVNLSDLLQEILQRFENESQRLQSPIHLQTPSAGMNGHWDVARLEQVIGNLVSNAIKYGAGQPVHLVAERRDDHVVIQVKDRGIGIAPEDQERIFSRFERAVPDRNFGGFGLGLWMCREMLAAMGGTITVISEAGKGATFEVTLPMQVSAPLTAVAS